MIDFGAPRRAGQALRRGALRQAVEALRRAQRPLPRAGSLYRRRGRRARRDHHRHQHGRPRHRHPARRQSRHAPARRNATEHAAGAERDAKEAEIRAEIARFKEKAIAAGGLYIIGTERHESRRIDNQLRGRAGRQGDPGRSKFFLSLQDDLMRIFGSDRMDAMLRQARPEGGRGDRPSLDQQGAGKGAAEGRGAQLRHAQEHPEIRQRHERPAQGRVRAAPRDDGAGVARRDHRRNARMASSTIIVTQPCAARRLSRSLGHRGPAAKRSKRSSTSTCRSPIGPRKRASPRRRCASGCKRRRRGLCRARREAIARDHALYRKAGRAAGARSSVARASRRCSIICAR